MKNLWRDINPKNNDETWNVVVEIPNGSQSKYEFNLNTGVFELEKELTSEQIFIFDYGFIPQTLGGDGDPLDVIILSSHKLKQGDIVRVNPIGIMRMLDEGEVDDKIIGFVKEDKYWKKNYKNTKNVEQKFKEIEEWFRVYKKIDGTELKITGFDYSGEVIIEIEKAIKNYQKSESNYARA